MNPLSLRVWRSSRSFAYLVCLGLVTEIIYLLAFLVPFPLLSHYTTDTDMMGITHHSAVGFLNFVVSFCLLFGCMGVATILTSQPPLLGDTPTAAIPERSERKLLGLVLMSSLVFVLTLVFVYPITAIDLFNYVAESRLLVHYHQNPIFVAPCRHVTDHIMALSGGWCPTSAPYGPLGILVDAWPAMVAGGNLLWNLLLLKLMFGALVIVEAVIVYRILQRIRPALALSGLVLVAWNPLVLFEFAANGHNDIVMLVLASVGVLCLIERPAFAGIVLIAASVLIKFATFSLLPLALIFVLTRNRPTRHKIAEAIAGFAIAGLMVWLVYLPFWQGTRTLNRTLLENTFGLQSFGSLVQAIVPSIPTTAAVDIGRILYVPLYVVACYLSSREAKDFILGLCIGLIGFIGLFAANVKIWYLSWPSVFSALNNSWTRSAVALMALGASLSAAVFSYVFVWTNINFRAINAVAYLMAFAPALLLIVPLVTRRRVMYPEPEAGVAGEASGLGQV